MGADDQPPKADGEDKLLPLEEGDQTVLSPESAGAIETLKAEIARLEGAGAAGFHGLRVLLDQLGEAVFDYGERMLAVRQEEAEAPSLTMVLFAERNLEAMVRYLTEEELLTSAVRFILREADESLVVAHAMAGVKLLRTGSTDHLRAQGAGAYKACQLIAQTRGFAPRVDELLETSRKKKR